MNFIDQYKELYPDPKPVEVVPADPVTNLDPPEDAPKKEAKVVPVPLRALKPTK